MLIKAFNRVALTTAVTVAVGFLLLQPPGQVSTVELLAAPGDEQDRVCPPGERECRKGVEEGGGPGDTTPGDGDPGGSSGPQVCTYDTGDGTVTVSDRHDNPDAIVLAAYSVLAQYGEVEIPCYLPGKGWYDGDHCYLGPVPPVVGTPPPPAGKTDADGAYYYPQCFLGVEPNGTIFFDGVHYFPVWVDFEDVPTVTPQELALRAIAEVGLDGAEIQTSPPETGAGLVDLPVWLGVNPTEDSNWGPVGQLECDGALCVEISARVTSVEWDMGDGTIITCNRNEHETWERGENFLAPDGCHHIYDRASRDQPAGRYQITATSTWTVEWNTTSGGGDSDVETTQREAQVSLRIDEIQVLVDDE